jgi:hypothetical protein
MKCGYGRLSWPDGSIFEGYWYDDRPISIGVFKTADGKIYEGLW